MSVVDASILVAVYHARDVFHQPSRVWLHQQLQAGALLVAPLLILSEVAGPITRQTGLSQAGYDAIQQIRALPRLILIPIDDDIATLGAELAADLHLRGADAIYVAVAALMAYH